MRLDAFEGDTVRVSSDSLQDYGCTYSAADLSSPTVEKLCSLVLSSVICPKRRDDYFNNDDIQGHTYEQLCSPDLLLIRR